MTSDHSLYDAEKTVKCYRKIFDIDRTQIIRRHGNKTPKNKFPIIILETTAKFANFT